MSIKYKINAVLDSLIVQDYILFTSVFVLFLVLMILAVYLRRKKNVSRLLASSSFLILLLGPTFGYIQMHKFLFKNGVELIDQKKLEFTKAIVVKGELRNDSSNDFRQCKIIATAYRKTTSELKNYILRLKPIQKSSFIIKNVRMSETKEFKMFIEPFDYEYAYKVGLEASCK